jgi:adenine-specific DNA-methyltransferase
MPRLTWLGKDKVVNHHNDVPFRVLNRRYTYGQPGGNMLIRGDNLDALKTLLPQYEGRVKCIYIDPPYNTGNEGWVYNDNVNDPKIRKWLGEVVGKEGEDLTRHDKWLCMMYPRLRLLHRLLADDGIIAVSIDDNEVFYLGAIMNEIFGISNRIACAPWRSEPSGGKDKTVLRTGHEYILFYTKGTQQNLSKEEKSVGKLDLKDSFGKYRKGRELRKWGATSDRADRPNLWFELKTPEGITVLPYKNDGSEGYWRWGRTNNAMAQILQNPELAHWEFTPYDNGVMVNGENYRWVPYEKIREEKRSFGWNSWLDGYGTNADATSVIKKIFGQKDFETPKPPSLIEWIVSLYDSNDDDVIVLDSFAGSGTTAHAVLNLNKQDGGNRRFILVEMEDYAETITAERIRRVIDGYGDKPGTGGGFDFYDLGEPLLYEDGNLNENIDTERIREYVWYTETKSAYSGGGTPEAHQAHEDVKYYLGEKSGAAYWFYYERGEATTLDVDFLRRLNNAERYVIYADMCALSAVDLERFNITFKKIPRDIGKL